MVDIKTILVFVAVTIIVGSSGVINIIENGIYFAMCGGCSEGAQGFGSALSTILTAGQSDVVFGVNGLIELQQTVQDKEKASMLNQTFEGGINSMMIQGLVWIYALKIILGSLLTVIYIWILTKIVKFPFNTFAGWEPPIFVTLFLAIAITGLLHWGFSGWTQYPFQGWITLAQHPELWSMKAFNAVSPIPDEAFNNISLPNQTITLP